MEYTTEIYCFIRLIAKEYSEPQMEYGTFYSEAFFLKTFLSLNFLPCRKILALSAHSEFDIEFCEVT